MPISSQHRDDIRQVLRNSGLLKNDTDLDNILTSAEAKPAAARGFAIGGGFCELLCKLGQAGCKLLCGKISDPTGQQLCMSACDTAETVCEQKCH